MHWFTYCLSEASASLWRQRGASLMAVLTIAAALFILGGFVLATENTERLLTRWSAAAEFSIYLNDDIGDDQRVALNRLLASDPAVASREYVSKGDAVERFTRDFPDLAGGIGALERNPLPASIEVRLKPEAARGQALESFAGRITAAEGVSDVRYDRRWIERLGQIVVGVRWTGWLLGGVLVLGAMLTVSTVVRLAIHARRDELEIMQLMGAPIGLLRGPAIAEGVLQGGAGAIVALGALGGAFHLLRAWYGNAVATVVDVRMVEFLSASSAGFLIVGGMAVGCLGGLFAARRVR
jgi:cell division transport system permease protein